MTQGKANNVEEFLGIDINSFNKTGKRAFIITQHGIINDIINTCSIYGCNTSTTQKAIQYPLVTDEMKNPNKNQYQWKYSSAIRIMMYVKSNYYK